MYQSICDLNEDTAEEILSHDELWRGDGTYLKFRKKHDAYLRQAFIAKGGNPKLKHPIYMLLGDSPTGPHDMHPEYPHSIKIPLTVFPSGSVSFTYPDSMYKVPLDDLGRVGLERDPAPIVYLFDEIDGVIERYKVFEHNNHYIEAQVWDTEPLIKYL